MLKEMCQEDVDFEFVPLAHVFLHFLCSFMWTEDTTVFDQFRDSFLKRIIIAACVGALDRADSDDGATLKALFTLLDPRGGTILHAASDAQGLNLEVLLLCRLPQLSSVPSSIKEDLFNAPDGAGRTILHQFCIHNDSPRILANYIAENLERTGVGISLRRSSSEP